MNPLRLRASNYRSFAELDLEVPSGCVAVVGENGAGKSSIVNVLELALFGARNFGDYLSDQAPDKATLTVELEFEHGGESYRVRRSKKGNGAVKVDFEGWAWAEHSGSWAPLTRETAAATQALIEETIGLSRETFRASAFLAQGDGAAFTEAQPRERKAILAEVLGLELWDKLLELAKKDRVALDDTGHRLSVAIEAAEAELVKRADIEASRSELVGAIAGLEEHAAASQEERAELQAQVVKAREQDVERRGLAEQLTTARAALSATLERVESLRKQRPDAPSTEDVEALEAEAARVPALEQELDDLARYERARAKYRELLFERNRLLAEASELNERANAVRGNAELLSKSNIEQAKCETCGQSLGEEERQRILSGYAIQADELDKEALQKDAAAAAVPLEQAAVDELEFRERGAIELELAAARNVAQAVSRVAANRERAKAIGEELARLEERAVSESDAVKKLLARLEGLEEAGDAEVLEHSLAACETRLAVIRSDIENARGGIAVANDRLARLESLAGVTEGQRIELKRIRSELDVVAVCERAYGRDGIPTMIVENAAIPQIEVEANRILAELGTSFRVELHTQRELKAGGVAESLDIIVVAPGGARAYETFSGGERTRLNLALRIALARLLAHRRGAEVRVLVVDEPEFLDEPGVARLAEVLRGLSADFERVVLISHQPALQESFDEVLTVTKDEAGSRIASPALEAAIA